MSRLSNTSSGKTASKTAPRVSSSSKNSSSETKLDMSKWQSTLQGGLSFAMSESVLEEGDKTLAAESDIIFSRKIRN